MARKKNATFAGVPIMDADVGVATFGRDVENVTGDVALIFDKATGENSEANVIVHDGDEGALLGAPIINQWIDRTLKLTSHDTASKSGGIGETWIYPVPFHLAAGETQLIVEVGATIHAGLVPFAKVCDTSNAEVTRKDLVLETGFRDESADLWRATLTGLTAGWNLFFVVIDTTDIDTIQGLVDGELGHLFYVRARPRLSSSKLGAGVGSEASKADGPRDAGGDVYGVTTPAATEGIAHTSFDDGMFADLESIDGYWASRLNRNLTGLEEAISASPAGGNTSYVHEDQDGAGAADDTNPARVRFEAHSQALYANEGQIDFPVWCEAFGAGIASGFYVVDEAQPPTKGMLQWYAPWSKDETERVIRTNFFNVPDFQSAASRLQCAVLFLSTNEAGADPTQWTIKARTSTGNATASPVDTDGNQILWLAIITAVPFTGDRQELFELLMSRASAKPASTPGIGEIAALGAALAFVKP